jgi:hypothetical protein
MAEHLQCAGFSFTSHTYQSIFDALLPTSPYQSSPLRQGRALLTLCFVLHLIHLNLSCKAEHRLTLCFVPHSTSCTRQSIFDALVLTSPHPPPPIVQGRTRHPQHPLLCFTLLLLPLILESASLTPSCSLTPAPSIQCKASSTPSSLLHPIHSHLLCITSPFLFRKDLLLCQILAGLIQRIFCCIHGNLF